MNNAKGISKNEDGISVYEVIMPSVIGVGIAAAVAAVLLLIVGIVIYSTADPNKLVTGASLVILAVSSFAAGLSGSKKGGSFVTGLISGVTFALLLWVAALISGGEGSIDVPYSYFVRLGGLFTSVIGALLGARGGHGRRFASTPKVPKIKKR